MLGFLLWFLVCVCIGGAVGVILFILTMFGIPIGTLIWSSHRESGKPKQLAKHQEEMDENLLKCAEEETASPWPGHTDFPPIPEPTTAEPEQ